MNNKLLRAYDIIFSLVLFFLLLPILFLLFIICLAESGQPIFIQKRVGQFEKTFNIMKFRTMRINTPSLASHLVRKGSVTKVGKFIRKLKLDELPQLINVFKGEMSFIGPRPIIKDEIIRYKNSFEKAFSVLPGMSGLWQVSGRNKLSYKRRINLDLIYAKNINFLLDLNIFFRTIGVILLPFDRGAF